MKSFLLIAAFVIASCSTATNMQPVAETKPATNAQQKSVKEVSATTSPKPSGQKYEFDKEHTTIMFAVDHLGFSNMIGTFKKYDGYFIFNEEHPELSFVDITIKPAGISTSSYALDKELQGENWFNVAKFPEAHFKSTKVEVTGDHKAEVTGWFTLKGITKPITLEVTFNKMGTHPIINKTVAGFKASTSIKRSDFDMNSFVPMVGEFVHIDIETEGLAVK